MGWWTALFSTMGTRRADRIARAESDQLLAGRPAAPQHAGLAVLLSEAAAPPRPQELAGEAEAVAAFLRVRTATPSTVEVSVVDRATGGRRQRAVGPPWRGATMRLAVMVVLLAAAGTAGVTLGFRPVRMQPAPTQVPPSPLPTSSPSPSMSGTGHPAGLPVSPSPAPSLASSTTQTSDLASATQLCQVWTDATDKAARDEAAAQLAPLIDRLDGPNGIPAFCKRLVGGPPSGTTTAVTTKAAPAKSATPAKPAAAPVVKVAKSRPARTHH